MSAQDAQSAEAPPIYAFATSTIVGLGIQPDVTSVEANARDHFDRTPLHIALTCKYNVNVMTQFLIDHGADVNASDKNGWTPLLRAAQNGYYEVVKLLCMHGADINAQTKDVKNALSLAISRGYHHIVAFLLGHGSDMAVCNDTVYLCRLALINELRETTTCI
jgi:ankyrin repeat protein